jgi:hypothetical protein
MRQSLAEMAEVEMAEVEMVEIDAGFGRCCLAVS